MQDARNTKLDQPYQAVGPISQRGGPIGWALIGSLVMNVGGLAAFVLPNRQDIPGSAVGASVVFAIVAIVGALGLWNGHRWGARTTIAVVVVNALSGLGALFDSPTATVAIGVIVLAAIGLAVVVLLRRPDARARLNA